MIATARRLPLSPCKLIRQRTGLACVRPKVSASDFGAPPYRRSIFDANFAPTERERYTRRDVCTINLKAFPSLSDPVGWSKF